MVRGLNYTPIKFCFNINFKWNNRFNRFTQEMKFIKGNNKQHFFFHTNIILAFDVFFTVAISLSNKLMIYLI